MNLRLNCVHAIAAFLVNSLFVGECSAAISTTGNVSPDPNTTTSGTTLDVGGSGSGTMSIDGGSDVVSGNSGIAYDEGVHGSATVTGSGSSWTLQDLLLGYSGTGSLDVTDGGRVDARTMWLGLTATGAGNTTITGADSRLRSSGELVVGASGTGIVSINDGAQVDVAIATEIAIDPLAHGEIRFDNGTLNTGGLYASFSQLQGAGTINARGLVSDIDLVFDQSHGLQRQWLLDNEPNQNVALNLNVDGSSTVGAGFRGAGTLTIKDGFTLASKRGNIGTVKGSFGVATIDGAVWNCAESIFIGSSGHGEMIIKNSGKLTSGVINNSSVGSFIGFQGNSSGSVTVTGAGSIWTAASTIGVGSNNTKGGAALNILDGGKVIDTGAEVGGSSTANVIVDGIGSSWINNGQLSLDDKGSLTITEKGKVTALSVSLDSAKVKVDGVGSKLAIEQSVYVGEDGQTAELMVSNGGQVTAGNFNSYIGRNGSGKVIVTGPESRWTNLGPIVLADGAFGDLLIFDGGSVTTADAMLGKRGTATVVISGPGSIWECGSLSTGTSGLATVTISDGGKLYSASGSITSNSSNSITVTGAGSSWSITGGLTLGNTETSSGTATLNIGDRAAVSASGEVLLNPKARLNLSDGALTLSSIAFVGASGQFNWTGGTLHVGTYSGNLTNSAGVLAPGQSPGKTTITGNYIQQAAGTLQIEIGGLLNVTQYDSVSVTGTTTLGGTLQLTLLDGFAPTAANMFTALSSTGDLTGSFSNAANGQRLLASDGLGTFLVNYGAGSAFDAKQVVLSAFNIVGDFNSDGVVDGGDYLVWRKSLGTNVSRYLGADGDGDGTVDNDDYAVWRSHFGMTPSSGAGAGESLDGTAVPEPAALIAVLSCTPLVIMRRRRV